MHVPKQKAEASTYFFPHVTYVHTLIQISTIHNSKTLNWLPNNLLLFLGPSRGGLARGTYVDHQKGFKIALFCH